VAQRERERGWGETHIPGDAVLAAWQAIIGGKCCVLRLDTWHVLDLGAFIGPLERKARCCNKDENLIE
jgi:hypothetical protein